MVQIPTSRDVAYSGVRSGRIAAGGPSVSVGAAVADAGQTLVRSAFNLQTLAEREQKDVLDDRSNVVSTNLTKFLGDEEQRFLKAQDESSESGIGFTRSYLEGWQKRADEFAKANFEGLTADEQTRYTNTLLNRGNDLYAKADGFEAKQKGAYYDRTTNQNLDTVRTQIRSNAADFGQLKEQGLAAINSANMPEAWKAERRAQWDADAAESKWRWKFDSNPTEALSEIKGNRGSIVDKIVGVESGGNDNARNPNSSAGGAGQFIDSTWLAMVKKYRPDLAEGKSAQELLALKSDGSLSREMTGRYAQENAEFLKNQGIQTTDGNVYLAHFLGPRGAAQALKADPSASVESVLGASVVGANPFLKGKSIADLRAWSDKKMGGAGVASDYAAIPYDRRETLINWGEGEYTKQVNQQKQETRGFIETAVANAPAAIQNTGTYQNAMPTPEQFNMAYGGQDGPQRYDAFRAAVETSQEAYKFQTMPESEVVAAVKLAEPKSSGDNAELETKRYDALSRAAAETLKAREADPSTYTQRAFPAVANAWTDAQTSGDYSQALSITAATQQQLGIRNMQLLPKQIADDAVEKFKDGEAGAQDRLNAVAGLVFSTRDPAQRQAVYKQLTDAGLPQSMDGVFEAMARGDRGAANRLMEAVITDPAKLPSSRETTPAAITEGIYGDVWAPGEIGYTAYGLSYGDATSLERAQRGTDLMNKAVRLRMSRGEDMQTAIDGAKKDLFGDKVVFSGNGTVHADLAVNSDVDQTALSNGLAASKESFRQALTAQRDRVLGVPSDKFMAQPNPAGLLERGNIDLTARPQVKNEDGSVSTVRSMSFNEDDTEILVPTVSDDGRILSDQEAIDLYHQTGKFLGKFKSPGEADAYAEALHNQQDAEYVTAPGQRAILGTATENRINDILSNGVFVQTGNGIGLRDPYTGQFVADSTGRPLTIPMEEVLRKGAGKKADAAHPMTKEEFFNQPLVFQ